MVRASMKVCTEISDLCPVEYTVLGYYPNLGSSIFFSIAFGICTIAAAYLAVWKRTWTYSAPVFVGLLLETLGYIGRIFLKDNPWNSGAFQLQICCIILAPTFICVSVYLTLKHIAINLAPSLSRLRPRWYPIIFLPADLTCLIVQAIGGGIAAAAGRDNAALQRGGNQAIIAGVALQVVVLLIFGGLSLDYFLRVRKYMGSAAAQGTDGLRLWNDAKFRKFGMAVSGAFATILVRCIYRIAEMAGGWGNHIMQDEISFLILDSSLVLVAVYLLTVFHPGLLFPQMRNGQGKKEAKEDVNDAAGSSNEGTKVEGS